MSGAAIDWNDPKPAPGHLAVVQDFVNTAIRLDDSDELATTTRGSAVLAALGLLDRGRQIDEADRRQIVAFREALRRMILTHRGGRGAVDAEASDALNRVVGAVAVHARFSPQGRPTVQPADGASPAHQVIGAVLGAITVADARGDWRRLKACHNPDCRWAFYDASRNRSGRWCDMNVCGARHKMRTYRERRQ